MQVQQQQPREIRPTGWVAAAVTVAALPPLATGRQAAAVGLAQSACLPSRPSQPLGRPSDRPYSQEASKPFWPLLMEVVVSAAAATVVQAALYKRRPGKRERRPMQFETFAKRLFFAVLLLHTLLLLLTPPQPRLAYFYSLPSSLQLCYRKVFTRIPIWRDDDDKLKTRHQQSAA